MTHRCPIGVVRDRVQLFRPSGKKLLAATVVMLHVGLLGAAESATMTPAAVTPLPDVGSSILRLCGALVFVIGLFLACVWGFRKWQNVSAVRSKGPRLVILDVQSLGPRQSIYVVAYEKQRLLIGSSAAGVSLITHLPEGEAEVPGTATPVSFAAAFQQVISRKTT